MHLPEPAVHLPEPAVHLQQPESANSTAPPNLTTAIPGVGGEQEEREPSEREQRKARAMAARKAALEANGQRMAAATTAHAEALAQTDAEAMEVDGGGGPATRRCVICGERRARMVMLGCGHESCDACARAGWKARKKYCASCSNMRTHPETKWVAAKADPATNAAAPFWHHQQRDALFPMAGVKKLLRSAEAAPWVYTVEVAEWPGDASSAPPSPPPSVASPPPLPDAPQSPILLPLDSSPTMPPPAPLPPLLPNTAASTSATVAATSSALAVGLGHPGMHRMQAALNASPDLDSPGSWSGASDVSVASVPPPRRHLRSDGPPDAAAAPRLASRTQKTLFGEVPLKMGGGQLLWSPSLLSAGSAADCHQLQRDMRRELAEVFAATGSKLLLWTADQQEFKHFMDEQEARWRQLEASISSRRTAVDALLSQMPTGHDQVMCPAHCCCPQDKRSFCCGHPRQKLRWS